MVSLLVFFADDFNFNDLQTHFSCLSV